MEILNNKRTRRLFEVIVTIIILYVISVFAILNYQKQQYNNKLNILVNNIICELQINKNLSQEDIVKIVTNSSDDKLIGEDILKDYGVDSDTTLINELNKYENKTIVISLVTGIIYLIIIVVTIFIYLKNRKKKIDELITYLDNIQNKNYLLDIEESSEDELNSLKTELYKLTVMLREKANESQNQKEEVYKLVSDISHQLKTPLTSMQILLDNLTESKSMDETTRNQFIFEIARKAESMNWLIRSLLKLSRLDASAVEFKKDEINLDKLLKDVVSDLEILSEVKNVTIKAELNSNIVVKGDRSWNKEAISNIVKNAIEHANSNVEIKITNNKVYTQIEVIDDGNGIGKKDIQHIFDRFYKSSTSDESSVGIGLALSKSIIEKQNGYIGVESKENQGTTFIIKYMNEEIY